MKLHKSYLRILLLLLLVFLPKVAKGDSHYRVKVSVSVYETPAKGSVYVTASSTDTSGQTSLTLDSTNNGGGELTFYLYGNPNLGYELKGWYEESTLISDSGKSPYEYKKNAPTSEKTDEYTLKASFVPKPYYITYDTKGGLPNSIDKTCYNIETSSISLPDNPTKDESNFKGWTVTSTDSKENNWDPSIDPGITIISGPDKHGNVTLTAEWETKTYTAKFYDGDKELENLRNTYNKAEGFTMPDYSKKHYIFQYWEIVEAPVQGWTEEHYPANTKIADKNGDVTFKAVWTPVPYNISYDTKGGSPSSIDNQIYTYDDKSINLPQKPTKDESDFNGWNVSGANHNWGEKIGKDVISINERRYGDVTLSADWITKTYTAKFYDGETELTALEISDYTKADGFTLPEYSKDYYSFKNWEVIETDGQDWTDGPYDANSKISGKNGNVKFRAVWDKIEYKITYEPSGGTLTPNENTQIYTYVTKTISLYEVSKEESTFTGWEVASTDGSPNNWPTSGYIQTSSIEGPKFGNVTLTATWDVTTYDVKFYDNDGTTQLNLLPDSYSKVDGFAFPSYSKPGYSVDYWEVIGNPGGGWTNDEAEQNYKPGKTINGKNATVSFKAHYKLETYTITYKHNDGKGTESTMTYDYEHDFTLTVPEKSGCVFKEWKPEAASGWWEVSEQYKGTITAGKAYGDVTLIAQWLGGLIVKLEGGEDVSEDCYAVFKVSGGGVEYLISVSKNHPEVLGSLENGETYTIESMDWHKAYILDSVKQEIKKVDDEQTVTFTATKTTPKVSDSHRDF